MLRALFADGGGVRQKGVASHRIAAEAIVDYRKKDNGLVTDSSALFPCARDAMCNLLRAARDETRLISESQANRMSDEREQYADRSALINKNLRKKFNCSDKNNKNWIILYFCDLKNKNQRYNY